MLQVGRWALACRLRDPGSGLWTWVLGLNSGLCAIGNKEGSGTHAEIVNPEPEAQSPKPDWQLHLAFRESKTFLWLTRSTSILRSRKTSLSYPGSPKTSLTVL